MQVKTMLPYGGLLLAVLLAAGAFSGGGARCWAADQAKSVFGFVPGKAFPKALEEQLEQGDDGYSQYRAECPEPDAPFELIKVRVSPRTRLVVDVSAAGVFHDCGQGRSALWRLKDALERQYGKAVKKRQSGGERYEIKKKGLRIVFYLRSATFEDHCLLYENFMHLGTYKKSGKEAQAVLEQKPSGTQP